MEATRNISRTRASHMEETVCAKALRLQHTCCSSRPRGTSRIGEERRQTEEAREVRGDSNHAKVHGLKKLWLLLCKKLSNARYDWKLHKPMTISNLLTSVYEEPSTIPGPRKPSMYIS